MKLALTLFALTLIGCSKAETTHSEAAITSTFDTVAMDRLLSEAVSRGDVIGTSAMVFDEGDVVYQGAFGLSDRERETPVNMDTVWRIYSMTKPVTSVVIMDLQEEGKLKLSDPVSKYIPKLANMKVAKIGKDEQPTFVPQAQPITLEDLMLHRSGMGYGIDVLGRVAEVAEGKSLGEVMNERIFDPLGMSETGFGVRPDQKARFVSNYYATDDGSFALAEDGQNSPYSNRKNKFQSGGGGLVSTLGDYAKFAQMMLDGGTFEDHRVLDEATVELMMQDHMGQDKSYLQPWLGLIRCPVLAMVAPFK